MAIEYGYVDPSQMTSYQLVQPGEGTFRIKSAEEKISRAGNNMLVVTFLLTDSRGQSTLANEYLLESQDETQNKSTATKVYNILNGIGRPELYGLPLEPKHLLHGRGKCIIKTQKSEDPQYADKSVISKYVYEVNEAPENIKEKDVQDDIPF